MSDRIHDDEIDTSEATVRSLLADQLPSWADAPMSPLHSSGTTNALWRLRGAGDLVVRLPRMRSGARGIDTEVVLLPRLAETGLTEGVAVPELVHAGAPSEAYPLPWMAVRWLDGDDLWEQRDGTVASSAALVDDLAAVVHAIGAVADMPAPARPAGSRGGPLGPLLNRLDTWLSDPAWAADRLVDVAAVRRCAAPARELTNEEVPTVFVHGDLIPGNLLITGGRLSAVIDWGGAGHGDPAQDLAPAWAVFDERQRTRFRTACEVDDATWLRARTIELEHAVGGVLYYRPRDHPLGDVMARTLERIIAESI